MDFPLKELPLKHLSSSSHGTVPALHPASLFQRIQCQINSSISSYHPSLPACLPSLTHAVFSPAYVDTKQFQPFCLLGETNIKPLYQIKVELTADHNIHAFSF